MAAPAYASSSTTVSAIGTFELTKPSGVVAGSLLVTVATIYNTDETITTLAGWTFRRKVTGTGTDKIYLHVYERIADGGEGASFLWSKSGSAYTTAACVRIAGADTSAPFDTSTGNEGTGTCTATGLTTAAADELLLTFTSCFNDAITGDYSGFSRDVTYDTVCFVHTKAQASAGATGNFTAAHPGDEWAAIMLAYKSPSAAGGFPRRRRHRPALLYR